MCIIKCFLFDLTAAHIAQVIALDENDQIVGHVNKYLSHRFVPGTPRGILHRAFSVFLFDQDGKLLLQKVCGS